MAKGSWDDRLLLRALARFFRVEHRVWPLFSHALFQSWDAETLNDWRAAMAERDRRWKSAAVLSRDELQIHTMHFFYVPDEDLRTGYYQAAKNSYLCLLRQAYDIALDGASRSQDAEMLKHFRSQAEVWPWLWMEYVHSKALANRPDLQRAWDGQPLPEGMNVVKLPCGVFLGSALLVERMLMKPSGEALQHRLSLDQRNAYCYELRCRGASLGDIAAAVNKHAEWKPLSSPQHAWEAIKAHCKKTGQPPPPRA